ncbi:MAG: cytochrome c [Gammaproteobacteria bacterium]|nr:cytochrome c [Gammaproteobacteria bacterium]
MSAARAAMALLVLLGAGATAAAGDERRTGDGAQIYTRWCLPCHGAGPGHPGTQALQAKYQGNPPAELERRTDLTPAVIRSFVRQGISVMAPFRKTEITDEELDALAAWLTRPQAADPQPPAASRM